MRSGTGLPLRWVVAATKLGRALMLLSLVLSLGTITLWVRGTDWIRYDRELRRPLFDAGGTRFTDFGIRSIGIYSHHGRIGLLRLEWGMVGLEDSELATLGPADPKQLGWLWSRTGKLNDYMGGVPDPIYPQWRTYSFHHCVSVYSGTEGGSRHFNSLHAVMVPIPLVLGVCLIPGAAGLAGVARRSRRRRTGHCRRCGYDLRASPERCPECGAQINPASKAAIDRRRFSLA